MNVSEAAAEEYVRRSAEAELCRRDLAEFFRQAWDVLEPGTPLSWNWYFKVMADHLMAVSAGKIQNLAIALPPGTAKSTLASVVWPVWEWIHRPQTRFLTAGNDLDLASKFSMDSRRLIDSDWFQERWGGGFSLAGDRNRVQWYENDRRGWRSVRPVGGKVTGRRSNIVLLDDPDDYSKVFSQAERDIVKQFWRAFYSRVANPRKAKRVVVGQQVHADGLLAVLSKSPEFEYLEIREEFEPAKFRTTSLNWKDPRAKQGDWLRPDRFGETEKQAAILTYGHSGYRAQYQQEPENADGSIFKEQWLQKRWRRNGPDIELEDGKKFNFDRVSKFMTVDPAASAAAGADFTVMGVWCVSPWGDLIWLDCVRKRLEQPDQPPEIKRLYDRYRLQGVGVEKVLNQTGTFQYVQRMAIPVIPLSPNGKDKATRAQRAVIMAQTGRLWLPAVGVVPEFPLNEVVAELLSFTGDDDERDDVVDCASYATFMMDQFGGQERPKFVELPKKEAKPWAQTGGVWGMSVPKHPMGGIGTGGFR